MRTRSPIEQPRQRVSDPGVRPRALGGAASPDPAGRPPRRTRPAGTLLPWRDEVVPRRCDDVSARADVARPSTRPPARRRRDRTRSNVLEDDQRCHESERVNQVAIDRGDRRDRDSSSGRVRRGTSSAAPSSASTAAPTSAPASAAAVDSGRRDRLVPHPEQRPGQVAVAGARRRIHGGAPEREDQDHGPRERGLQGQARDRRCQAATRPTCSSRGAAAAWPSRSTAGLRQGHHRAMSPRGRTRSTRAPWACTRSTASSTASRSTSAWSASGTTRTSSRRPGSPPAGHLGRAPRRRRQAQGRGHHRRSPSAARTSGRACSGGPTWRSASAARTPCSKAITTGDWSGPAFVEAGTELKKLSTRSRSRRASSPRPGTAPADRPPPWPTARPRCSYGPVGARAQKATTHRTRRASATSSAGSRSRPRRWRRRADRRRSAAATASPSARTPRPRPSTSSSSSSSLDAANSGAP